MATGTLFTYPQSFRANKALIAAQISGTDVKVASNFKLGETNKSADFLKKFPNGKVPAFEGKDGFCLSETNAIAYYVSNAQLRGCDDKQQAEVQQWISFSDNEVLPAACTWTFPCLGVIQFNKQDTERAKQQIQKVLDLLNKHLLTRTYLVGERVTLADISLVCNMQSLFELVLDPGFRKPYGNVNRWFTTLINQPQFKSVLGSVKLATSMATFDAKKYQELHAGAGGDKKKEKKTEKKAAQPKAKEEKPKPAPEPPQIKKWVDPLEDVPAGNMNLDALKRNYSNNECDVSVPYFWANVDFEHWSIWSCEYIEEIEKGTRGFMLSNLVGGMFQRIEKLRKHAFASVIILQNEEKKEFKIEGVWLFKGQKLAFELCEDWNIDAPSYKYTKLDPKDPKTKELVNKYLSWEGDFGDMKVLDGQIFK